MPVDQGVLDTIALSRNEYELIVARLGREPNEVELGMFGALWSEHCGYKNSKALLRLLPSQGDRVLTRQGAENAGAVDIGDGLCVVMKIESHNHPSAIEPYQGAATGVGGIVRDIFAMGARPIAILDSLRFGPLSEARNRYLFGGVVAGIGGYGNCLGIPTVGGEAVFEDTYSANPLVNAMCVGLAKQDRLVSGKAEGAGNVLLLVGADTGRDGLHGASGLASRSDPQAHFEELRPAVQVGNPFLEKLLMEACLELAEHHGSDWIAGIQDLGAAGLTSAAVEAAARGGAGVSIDVAAVPRREAGMTPYEVMLSESQERMLIIVRRGHEKDVTALFERWEVPWALIGRVTDGGLAQVFDGAQEIASLPVRLLMDAPEYKREAEAPAYLSDVQDFDFAQLPGLEDANRALLRLLADPNLASKRYIHRQYDQSVLNNTVIEAGADAAVLRIKGTAKAIALTTDCNGRYCYLDPYQGGMIAVAEAARNLACVGARPLAVTDCLNFGNPERQDVYWQMAEAVKGVAEACRALEIPVVSGNVSLYNETEARAVYPTPVIGMLGLIEDVASCLCPGSAHEGDEVSLLGDRLEQDIASVGGSEYLRVEHGLVAGQPKIDLEREMQVQATLLEAIEAGYVSAAHDCSEGGLAVALAEMCLREDLGLDAATLQVTGSPAAALFGEAQSRFIVAATAANALDMTELAADLGVPMVHLGALGGSRLRVGDAVDLSLTELREAHEAGLERALGG